MYMCTDSETLNLKPYFDHVPKVTFFNKNIFFILNIKIQYLTILKQSLLLKTIEFKYTFQSKILKHPIWISAIFWKFISGF